MGLDIRLTPKRKSFLDMVIAHPGCTARGKVGSAEVVAWAAANKLIHSDHKTHHTFDWSRPWLDQPLWITDKGAALISSH